MRKTVLGECTLLLFCWLCCECAQVNAPAISCVYFYVFCGTCQLLLLGECTLVNAPCCSYPFVYIYPKFISKEVGGWEHLLLFPLKIAHPPTLQFSIVFRPLNAGEAQSRFFSNLSRCVRKKCAHSIKLKYNYLNYVHAIKACPDMMFCK